MAGYDQLTDQEIDAQIAALERELGGQPPAGVSGTARTGSGPVAPSAPKAGTKAVPSTKFSGMTDDELDRELADERRAAAETPTLQEMHPAFSDADRLVVKNFSANNEAAVNYLQRKHKNLEISVDDATGQIKARARDGSEQAYRVLDPDLGLMGTLTSPKELLRDAGDVLYDAGSGIGTGAATAAGGLAGAAGTFGVGALPTAAGAGALASTGFEGLRQGLGWLLGIEDNFDAGGLAGAGIAGAASPLLFGTGGQVASGLGKKVLGEGLKDSAAAGIQSAQRGLVGRGFDAYGKPALAKLGSMASGASDEALTTLGRHYDTIRRMEQDPEAITNFTEAAGKNVGNRLRAAKRATWEPYKAALETAGEEGATVNVADVSMPLKEAIDEAAALAAETKTEASKDLLKELRGEFRRLFTYVEDVPMVDPETGAAMLDDAGKPIFQQVRRELDELSPAAAARLEDALGELAEFGSLKATGNNVGNRLRGMTKDEKQIATIGAEMKRLLTGSLEDTLGEGTIAARRQYGEIVNLETRAKDLLDDPKKAFAQLRNADKTANIPTQELFGKLDRRFGTDLIDRAKIAEAYATFRKPSATPLSVGGATSTSRSIPLAGLGAGLGYWAGSSQGGEGRGSGVIGGLIGGGLGGFLGSPAMLRRAIAAGIKGGQLNQGLGPLRPGVGGLLLQEPVRENMLPWLGVQP